MIRARLGGAESHRLELSVLAGLSAGGWGAVNFEPPRSYCETGTTLSSPRQCVHENIRTAF